MKLSRLFFAAAVLIAVLNQGVASTAAQETGWPRKVRHEVGEATLKAKPKRIVSTTPSVTGILLAIGAPVVASAATTPSLLTDNKGFFAQWADVADQRGVKILYPNLKFDIEAVIGWAPDLAVASTTGADSAAQHHATLEAQGVPTLAVNYSNKSWQELATELGNAAGVEDGAAAAIKRFDAHVAKIAASFAPPKAKVSIVGYNLGATYSVARTSSPVAKLISSLGFDVVGLPQDLRAQSARPSDFEFFSRENLSAAISGDIIFLLRGGDKDVEAFLADPILANHPAVANRRVYALGPTSFRIDYYSGLQLVEKVAGYFRKS